MNVIWYDGPCLALSSFPTISPSFSTSHWINCCLSVAIKLAEGKPGHPPPQLNKLSPTTGSAHRSANSPTPLPNIPNPHLEHFPQYVNRPDISSVLSKFTEWIQRVGDWWAFAKNGVKVVSNVYPVKWVGQQANKLVFNAYSHIV